MQVIKIQGARTHNLKNLSLEIPRNQLVIITGLSGSGKSSLAFDTLYAEGQRRYVESLSAYARQFLSMMDKPDVDKVEGLSPAIAIQQKTTSHNPRSTVGTVTEIYDYLRLLFARIGEPHCPEHGHSLKALTPPQIVERILRLPEGTPLMLLAPLVQGRKGEHVQVLEKLQAQGFSRVRIDGEIYNLEACPTLDKKRSHHIEAVVDRFKLHPEQKTRLQDSVNTALHLSGGLLILDYYPSATASQPIPEGLPLTLSARYACPECGFSVSELEPKLFSFNSPAGACPTCEGLGQQQQINLHTVIDNPQLSLAQDVLQGWDFLQRNQLPQLLRWAQSVNLDIHTPWNQLAASAQKKILYGYQGFIGIEATLLQRYREAQSPKLREALGRYLRYGTCQTCAGTRLNPSARFVFWPQTRTSLPQLTQEALHQLADTLEQLPLAGAEAQIAAPILREIRARLRFLLDVGLGYLSLARSADTLSGGESQRIRLASQIGSGLVGVMYVLDEPSIGLHSRDQQRLWESLLKLRDLGNSVLVVEHDDAAIRLADHVLDIGPGAGVHGGQIVAQGTPEQIAAHPESLTGAYLSGRKSIVRPPAKVVDQHTPWLKLLGASGQNLKQVDLHLPLGHLVCITGVSGSGKSTLINRTLYPCVAHALHKDSAAAAPEAYQAIEGLAHLDKVIQIDQSPIGRTPRSNPATYTGVLTPIRELFAATPEARTRGYSPGHFSFNVKGGRCEACQGEGVIRVEMHFLPDIYVECDQCHGARYQEDVLEIRYKGLSIAEVLALSVEDALQHFSHHGAITKRLQTLMDVGLGYITLGQSATTLSGGEAQRVKLARELAKRATGKTLYILDEPTTGLHLQDVAHLLKVLYALRDQGNTLVVIEHHLDVIKCADWVIDLGPEGGEAGGSILASGSPETLAQQPNSLTGQWLAPLVT